MHGRHGSVGWEQHAGNCEIPQPMWLLCFALPLAGPISQRVIRTVVRIVLPWALVAGAWLAFNVNLVRRPAFRRWAVGNGIASASPLSPRGLSFKEARNSSASGRSAGGRSILGNLLFMLFMRLQVGHAVSCGMCLLLCTAGGACCLKAVRSCLS